MRRPTDLLLASLLAALIAMPGVATGAGTPIVAATPDTLAAQLDAAFAADAGAAVALVRDGELVSASGHGLADRASRTPVTADTVFRAGSIGKSVVGVAVMLLVEEGRLSLDDTLASLAPGIAFDNPWESTDPVRLVHLLEHTAGWADLSPREFALDDAGLSLEDGIAVGGARVSRYPPGRYHAYSGAGHAIAAHVVATVAGMPFDEFARQRIFVPLGMTSATYRPVAGMARSYLGDGRETPYQHYPLYPSGGLNLSVTDLARFAGFLAGDGAPLLRPESLQRLWRAETTLAAQAGVPTGYGLGVASFAGRVKVLVGHGGAIDSYEAIYRAAPGEGVAYALMAGVDTLPPELLQSLDAFLGDDGTAPPPVPAPAASLADFAGTYQPIAQRNRMSVLLDGLSVFVPLTVAGDRMRVGGREAWVLDGALLRYTDRAVPTQALVATADGRELLGATTSFRRVSGASIAAKAAYGVVFVLSLLAALGLFATQTIRRRLGRPAVAAVLAFVPVLALVAVLLVAAAMPAPLSIARFGNASVLSVAVFVLTLLLPVGALLALHAGVRAPTAGRFARATALLAGLVVAVATLHLAGHGWIGLRTWALAG